MPEHRLCSLHGHPGWTAFAWDSAAVSQLPEQMNFQRDVLSGQLHLLGLDVRQGVRCWGF
jgi:Domain of unknown function (DUF4172)